MTAERSSTFCSVGLFRCLSSALTYVREETSLLIRPDEVLSRIANVAIPEVAHHALGVLLQHRHVFVGRLA